MSSRIVWKDIVVDAISSAREYMSSVGSPPTLRGLFYALVSRNVLPNTQNVYKRLSKVLVKAREDGSFPWEWLKDETRRTYKDNYDGLWSLGDLKSHKSEAIYDALRDIIDAIEEFTEPSKIFKLIRWDGQPKKVYILLEKEALADAISNFAESLGVDIIICKGYSSATSLHDLARQIDDEGRKVVLLHVGDFDPSGVDIQRYIEEKLLHYYNLDIVVERAMVDMDQINEHNLPSTPDTYEERAKMDRDPRMVKWEHGYFRVEVDAMVAIVPDSARSVIEDAIDKHFDYEIFENRDSIRLDIQNDINNELGEIGEEHLMDTLDDVKNIMDDYRGGEDDG